MRRLFILTLIIASSYSGPSEKEKLFESPHQETFKPRDGMTIEFVDSTSYIVLSGARVTEGTWKIEAGLTGTYLIIDSSEMKLEEISDSMITFTKGEFEPRFIRVKKHGTTKY